MKNKLKLLILAITLFAITPITNVDAATGRISVTSTSNTVSIGNTVSVTVKCTSTSPIGTCEYSMKYDSSKLKMTSGEYSVLEPGNGSSKTITKYYKFKAIANGSSTISVSAYAIRDWTSEKEISTSVSSTTITAKATSQSSPSGNNDKPKEYSTNNYLSSLTVNGHSLSPKFKKDTLNYTLTLDENIEKITINARAEDKNATISGIGEKKVSEGDNKINIIVTSEKGTKRTYTINATVKDKNPINVKVNNEDYTIVKNEKVLNDLETYKRIKIKIDDIDVPALYSDITKFTLVGLKTKDGDVNLFIYDENKNSYTPYNELKFDGLRFYPIETDKKLEGYIESKVTINELEINCFKLDKNSKYSVIYGMNIETGETGFYTYEESENTLQKYTDEIAKQYTDEIKKQKQFIIILGGVILCLCLLLIIIASIKTKNKKAKKKTKSEDITKLNQTPTEQDNKKEKKKQLEKQLDNW